jgi:pyruvate/2-oxoglutarate dehydrogenase complex dihydrolipoamide dehydrogenase (E3) component
LVQHLGFPFLPTWDKEPPYPNATFTDPEVAAIGPTLAKLHEKYHPDLIKTLHIELSETDKGYTEGLEQGFVQLHVVRLTGHILAATIVAPKASEMISLLTAAMYHNLSVYKLSGLIFPYPVLSEGIKKAADAFVFDTLPKLPRELGAYVRYRFTGPPAT